MISFRRCHSNRLRRGGKRDKIFANIDRNHLEHFLALPANSERSAKLQCAARGIARKQGMKDLEPTREQVSVSVFHCGAGCTIGDLIGEAECRLGAHGG